MDSKSIFLSKTLWANLLAPVFLYVATKYGLNLTPDEQATVVSSLIMVMNVILRLMTKESVHVVKPKEDKVA